MGFYMYIGFDYGTSNCSVATMVNQTPSLLAINHGRSYLPSTLSAPTRDAVCEYLFRFRNMKPQTPSAEQILRRAIAYHRDEDIQINAGDIAFGDVALERYLRDPLETYYVKSPKSFLGAMGLHPIQLQFFEDLVCAMMDNIKNQAEQQTEQSITQVVIGRPINFQGRGGAASNQQAQDILYRAAERCGYKDIEFQFEPVAAGLEYEATLTEDKTVLVVDIGGGTTDCSLLKMGPSWRGKADRQASLLAHSGQRIGGNDLDIHLAFRQLMPALGFGSLMQSGLEMPITQFWNPVAINDLAAQDDFYQPGNLKVLKELHKNAQEPEKLARLLQVYNETLGHNLVRRAEESKMALSAHQSYRAELNLHSPVQVEISEAQMRAAIEAPVLKMTALVDEVLQQAAERPDVIFMTGGSAQSPVLREAVKQALPAIPLVSGNNFGSVTAGLARWAQTCFE